MRSCSSFGSIRITFAFIALAAVCLASAVAPAFAADDAVEKSRLEKMLADGDTGMIVQVFRRYPGRTLPFIDSYLEGGLAIIEKGQDDPAAAAAAALESFRTGIRFAELADQAFGGTTFSEYANSFASWSPSEQKAFREGQREYKAGAREEDPEKALRHLRRSLALTRPLGDTWGMAMARHAIAEKLLASGDIQGASIEAGKAADLYGKLKLNSNAVESLVLAAEAVTQAGVHHRGLPELRLAWTIVDADATIERDLRAKVRQAYVAALEATGMVNEADTIRRAAAQETGAE